MWYVKYFTDTPLPRTTAIILYLSKKASRQKVARATKLIYDLTSVRGKSYHGEGYYIFLPQGSKAILFAAWKEEE